MATQIFYQLKAVYFIITKGAGLKGKKIKQDASF